MKQIKNVLIVGGGIGGLSLAIALIQKGLNAEIVELQKEYRISGSGIIQQANALRALDAIGVADEAMKKGSPYGQVNLCTPQGQIFGKTGTPAIGRFPSHNGITRKQLHDILLEKVLKEDVKIRMGVTVNEIENNSDEAKVKFTDGTTGTYDLVVACDGIYSKVRKIVFGEFEPKYVKASVWRYPFNRPKGLETGYMYFGKNSKVGLIPTTKDTIYMFVVTSEGDDNPIIAKEEFIPKLKSYLDEYEAQFVREVQSQITDPELVNYHPLKVVKIPQPWYKNRVIMIGDAAHATVPQLGSGAALAIEDAIVLAEEIMNYQSVSQTLEAFSKRRQERCQRIVDASEQLVEWERMEFQGEQLPEGINIGKFMGETLMTLVEPI